MASIWIRLLEESFLFSERITGIPQIHQISCICSIKMSMWKMSSEKLISILCRLGSICILALVPWVMAALLAQRSKAASTPDLFHQTCQRWANPWVRTLLTHLTRRVCLVEGRISVCCWAVRAVTPGALLIRTFLCLSLVVFPAPPVGQFGDCIWSLLMASPR